MNKNTLIKIPEILKDYYINKLLIKDIKIKYSIGKSTVIKILKEFGSGGRTRIEYENNKYLCDESFFEKINSHEKAYWFGFIAADGNIYNGKLQISLNKKDGTHLNKFCKRINYNGPIYDDRNQKRLMICRKKITEDLKSLGLIENKTLKINNEIFNLIPKEFLSSALHGYFDGDGCFSITQKKYLTFSLLGNLEFLQFFKNFLKENNIECSEIKKDKRTKQTYFIYTRITKDKAEKFKAIFYNNNFSSKDFLDRKKQKLYTIYP